MSPPLGTGTGAFLVENPLQGPQIDPQSGARIIDYWDPAVLGKPDGKALFYGGGPTFLKNRWDSMWFNGQQMPGLWSVKRGSPSLQIDQKKGPGHDGARLSLHGILPAEIEMTVTIWNGDQWNVFVKMVPVFWRRPTKDNKEIGALSQSLGISKTDAKLYQSSVAASHPALDLYGISNIIVRQPSLPQDGPIRQTKVITIAAIESLPPTKKAPSSKVVNIEVHKDIRRPGTEAPAAPHVNGGHPRGAGG